MTRLKKFKIIKYIWIRSTSMKLAKKDLNKIKKEIIKKNLNKEELICCPICKESKNQKLFDLDHKIPIFLGGQVFKNDNLQLICKFCHGRKTHIDLKLIALFKNLHFINVGTQGHVDCIVELEYLQGLYLEMFKKAFYHTSSYDTDFLLPKEQGTITFYNNIKKED